MKNLAVEKYRIIERKSSKFGAVGHVDVRNELERLVDVKKGKPMNYYDNLSRREIYRTCMDKYVHDQLARPIINLIVHALFSKPPDFQGDDKLVERADKIVRDSEIDWSNWGVDLEVHGDIFLRSFFGKDAKIASIPALSIDVAYDEKNVIDIKKKQ